MKVKVTLTFEKEISDDIYMPEDREGKDFFDLELEACEKYAEYLNKNSERFMLEVDDNPDAEILVEAI